MFDLSSEMENFYNEEVVLSGETQTDLHKKRKLNVDRLNAGLKEYNEENKTSYKVAYTVTQGSIAMHTAVQNDKFDYDIDVAIIFDKDNIDNLGTQAIKTIVVDALKRKCTGFSVAPEAKTNCVRIVYSTGYHVDFAIYRRIKQYDGSFEYEHAGSYWRSRDPKAITNWFKDEVKAKGKILRQVVRLLKMFSKSRDNWEMPGGLIQTVLCDEVDLSPYTRLDEAFYYCIKAIRDRIICNKEVHNPTDASLSLLLRQSDKDKLENLYSRLNTYIGKLDPLFNDECDKSTAYNVWNNFFDHDYWSAEGMNESSTCFSQSILSYRANNIIGYRNDEEFIEDLVPVEESHSVKITCEGKADGFRQHPLAYIVSMFRGAIPQNLSLDFSATNCTEPLPDAIWWKVKNVGPEAKRRDNMRGQIITEDFYKHTEHTKFKGPHYVECYVIKNGVCIALDHLEVPIGTQTIDE